MSSKIPQYKKIKITELFISGGKLVLPGKKTINNPGIYITNGKISKGTPEGKKGVNILQLKDTEYIAPGFIDLHCHLREPGNPESETIERGSLSAVAGGFTEILCMPNTNPPLDNPKLVKQVITKARRTENARVYVIASATKNREGKVLSPVKSLIRAGAVALSDDGAPIEDDRLMYKLLLLSKEYRLPIINHCEVRALSRNGTINDGKISKKLGLKGIPDIAESIMVLRDLILQTHTGGILHIAHVSTKKSVEVLRWAKAQGIRFTAETCPHYFTLTENYCAGLDPNYKVSPPLRTKADVEAIKEALADGIIEVIATDHAPWHRRYKQSGWQKARPGMIGLETAFSLGYEQLVLKKYLSLEKFIACLTQNPRRILARSLTLEAGDDALITIFDLSIDWIYEKDLIFSRSSNTPFLGRSFKGKITKVIVNNYLFIF
ncbi:MAG: dihydroorotase [candidate division WOR-3 bacterium]